MPQSTAMTAQNLSTRQVRFVHPTYSALQAVWSQLRDVREGIGGFLDGTYLVAHPREWQDHTSETPRVPTKKLKARRTLASYENFASTIIHALKAALTRTQPIRRVGPDETPIPAPVPVQPADGGVSAAPPKKPTIVPPPQTTPEKPLTPIEVWWENVDGAGTHIDDFLATAWDIAATFGHVHLYLDRAAQTTDALTEADQDLPFLRVYTPLDAPDWRTDDLGQLQVIKFAEVAPRPGQGLTQPWRPEVRYRIVDRDQWVLYDQRGTVVQSGQHQMGCLPVVTLFSQRRPLEPTIGDSVLGDPRLYIDLYNLCSEVRELLRNQTFGILNIPLGTGEGAMTLTEAQTMMGTAVGTENVCFSGLAAAFIQPDAANVTVYHEEIARKLRAIYRLISLTWEADSKDAEAEGSLKLKREDMNQRLSGYADELEQVEYALAELFYRAQYGAESGVTKLETDDVQVTYPDTFDMTPFAEVLDQANAARGLGMPALFLKELRKMLARKFTGMADLPESLMAAIDAAIDQAPDDPTPAEQAQQRLNLTLQAMKAGGKGEPPSPMKTDKAA